MTAVLTIDLHRCIGCDTCSAACSMEHKPLSGISRLKVLEIEETPAPGERPGLFWIPKMCQHCDDAPCVTVCPTRALWQSDGTGPVTLDEALCIGCGQCSEACPYDAITHDPVSGKADKCDLCSDRNGQGLEPMCVVVCPTRAISVGEIAKPNGILILNETSGTEPRIQFGALKPRVSL